MWLWDFTAFGEIRGLCGETGRAKEFPSTYRQRGWQRICHPLPVEVRLEPAWNLGNQCDLLCVGASVWNAKACELKVVLTSQVLQGGEPLCWEWRCFVFFFFCRAFLSQFPRTLLWVWVFLQTEIVGGDRGERRMILGQTSWDFCVSLWEGLAKISYCLSLINWCCSALWTYLVFCEYKWNSSCKHITEPRGSVSS